MLNTVLYKNCRYKSGRQKSKIQLPLSRLITVSCLLCANDNNYTELMHAKMKLVYRRWNLDERSGNNRTLERPIHRVDRVLGFFSSRSNWDYHTPSPASECAPSLVPGGGTQSLVGEWMGVPIPTRGQILWYSFFAYMYSVDPFIFLVWLSLVGTEKDTTT